MAAMADDLDYALASQPEARAWYTDSVKGMEDQLIANRPEFQNAVSRGLFKFLLAVTNLPELLGSGHAAFGLQFVDDSLHRLRIECLFVFRHKVTLRGTGRKPALMWLRSCRLLSGRIGANSVRAR